MKNREEMVAQRFRFLLAGIELGRERSNIFKTALCVNRIKFNVQKEIFVSIFCAVIDERRKNIV